MAKKFYMLAGIATILSPAAPQLRCADVPAEGPRPDINNHSYKDEEISHARF